MSRSNLLSKCNEFLYMHPALAFYISNPHMVIIPCALYQCNTNYPALVLELLALISPEKSKHTLT
jgi:hypothetical protein